tara:strand:- start:747 stop:1016 length:270 start_codon:yes stop_codon:yes gene_type:complete
VVYFTNMKKISPPPPRPKRFTTKGRKEAETDAAVSRLVKEYAKTGTKAETPTYDKLPANSPYLRSLQKLGKIFKGTTKDKLQINYEYKF